MEESSGMTGIAIVHDAIVAKAKAKLTNEDLSGA